MDKKVQLEALITEREGYIAENTHRLECGKSIAYAGGTFFALADEIRALNTEELAATTANSQSDAIALLHDIASWYVANYPIVADHKLFNRVGAVLAQQHT